LTAADGTFEQKFAQTSEIIQRFPGRKFILVGDSGEKDPEVYRKVKTPFPDHVQEIRIRDVVNDRERNPSRLKGMIIIPSSRDRRGCLSI
jgi:phosphatidate phosphatase APP1